MNQRVTFIAAAMLLGSAAFAHEPNSITIDYSDLDLTQATDVSALYRRVSTAARQVCQEPSPREVARYRHFKVCFDEAVNSAVDKLNVPQLTTMRRSR
jgi:UrcA family protein